MSKGKKIALRGYLEMMSHLGQEELVPVGM